MKKRLLMLAALPCLIACNQAAEPSKKNGTPKFKAGEMVGLKLSVDNGQVLSVDCEQKDPCKYRIRYSDEHGALHEADFEEFEAVKLQSER